MKITRLTIDNIMGVRHVHIDRPRRVTLIAGSNGAGKSSIGEAVRLALLADGPRLGSKKDWGTLVHDGAKAGSVEVVTDAGAYHVHITADGKVADGAKGREPPPGLAFVLDPQLFARLPAAERRAALYAILGLDLSPAAIKARLLALECEEAKVDAVAPMLLSGFEAAQKHAATEATSAKGAWRGVTGESYGEKKAITWRAPTPPFSGDDAAELHGLDKAIADLEAQHAEANQRLGIAEHEATQAGKRAAALDHLRGKAKTYAEHATLVGTAEKELARLKAELAKAQEAAGQKPKDWPSQLTCPHCAGLIMDSEDGESLVPWEPPPAVVYDAEAAARIPDLQKAIITQQRVLERHQGNLKDADEAAIQLKALEDETKPAKAETKPVDPETIRATVDTLKQQIETKRARQRMLQEAQRKLDEADEKTKAARKHHADVLAWAAIAEQLSPNGIPAKVLAEALGPVNERMAQSAADAEWPVVVIGEDMSASYGGRDYSKISESERWRADAMIAEAVSHASGLRLLLLDRFDVLDMRGREDALAWLDVLADQGEVETAIVLGTLKQRPTLPATMQAVWIEAGAVAAEKTAVAA